MSYLSKKAVLESIGEAYQTNLESPDQTDWDEGYRSALRFMKRTVLSGAFDADTSEVQRLRAALVEIKQLLNENRENDGAFQSWNHMQAWKVATQALSTTSEPCPTCGINVESACPIGDCEPTSAERVREYYRKLEELRNRTKYRDAAIEYEQRMTDICNVLDFLGITIPGINAPKKEGRTE